MIVVDASVAVKLVLEETDSASVRTWFRDVADDLIAPDLLAIEVAQAVVRRANMRQVSAAEAVRVLEDWRNFLAGGWFALVRSDPMHVQKAAHMGIDLGHPIKDCLYLALALDRDCDLVTCDVKFRDKASALYPRIRLLADVRRARRTRRSARTPPPPRRRRTARRSAPTRSPPPSSRRGGG